MNTFIQATINGISQGIVYALIALGYSIIYRTLKMGHFAQGEFYMFGAFTGLTIATEVSMNPIIVFGGAAIFTSLLMLITGRLAYRPLYGGDSTLRLLIATLGMRYVVQGLAQFLWGSDQKRFPALFSTNIIRIGNLSIPMQNVWIILIFIVLVTILMLFIKKSKMGVAMSAVSMNNKAASLMGINNNSIVAVTYIIAAVLAAIAGVMMGPIYGVSYTMGGITGSKAMTAAVMGGVGSLPGAMVGGILLGLIETYGALYLSTAYKDLFSFIVLIIILYWKPEGLLGEGKVTKV